MKGHVLFIHGSGEGAYEEDRELAASLRKTLGPAYDVRYPKMPNEERPEYAEWEGRISSELAALDSEMILVGHSVGAWILLKYLSEENVAAPAAGTFLLAAPYFGAGGWEVDEDALRNDLASTLSEASPMYVYHSRDDEVVCRSNTSRCTQNGSRRRPFASSMAVDISSTTWPTSLGISKSYEGDSTDSDV